MVWLTALACCIAWAGFWLIIDGLSRRGRQKDLAKRLAPFQPETVGDEAEVWLRNQK